jgi:hypothetical protein
MPPKIVQIHSYTSHHLEVVLPPKKESPRRFKNFASLARWYIHPRHWKQALSALAIYAALFVFWAYLCAR